MDEGFLRQRRNLISISLVLMLFMIAKGDINSLFGVKLEHEIVAIIFAWIGFFYFWWRCSIYGPDSINKAFEREKMKLQDSDPYLIKKGMGFLANYVGDIDENINVTISPIGNNNQWYFIYSSNKIHLQSKYTDIRPLINNKLLLVLLIRRWFRTAYFGKSFTDYFVPYFLAEVTLIIGMFKAAEKMFL